MAKVHTHCYQHGCGTPLEFEAGDHVTCGECGMHYTAETSSTGFWAGKQLPTDAKNVREIYRGDVACDGHTPACYECHGKTAVAGDGFTCSICFAHFKFTK